MREYASAVEIKRHLAAAGYAHAVTVKGGTQDGRRWFVVTPKLGATRHWGFTSVASLAAAQRLAARPHARGVLVIHVRDTNTVLSTDDGALARIYQQLADLLGESNTYLGP